MASKWAGSGADASSCPCVLASGVNDIRGEDMIMEFFFKLRRLGLEMFDAMA